MSRNRWISPDGVLHPVLEEEDKVTFEPFPKIPRLNRDIIISEKIDGTNACIWIGGTPANPEIRFGSRNRWVTPMDDNFGFAKWAEQNIEVIARWPAGWYFGEWWGLGIQRGYDLFERRFSVFNPYMYDKLVLAVGLDALHNAKILQVPVLYEGPWHPDAVDTALTALRLGGSRAANFDSPEGIIIYHTAARQYFKVTLENDEQSKGAVKTEDATG